MGNGSWRKRANHLYQLRQRHHLAASPSPSAAAPSGCLWAWEFFPFLVKSTSAKRTEYWYQYRENCYHFYSFMNYTSAEFKAWKFGAFVERIKIWTVVRQKLVFHHLKLNFMTNRFTLSGVSSCYSTELPFSKSSDNGFFFFLTVLSGDQNDCKSHTCKLRY